MMTIKELIKSLQEFPPNHVVKVATSPFDELEIASIYEDDKSQIVWIDVEEDI